MPNARITWIVGCAEAPLIENMPGIEVLRFDKSLGISAYSNALKQITHRFDLLLHMQLSLRANILAAMIKADVKIGYPTQYSRELHRWMINRSIEAPLGRHVTDFFMQFSRALGVMDIEPHWRLPVPDNATAWANACIAGNQHSLLIAPAASNPERNWLPERYAVLADHAHEAGFHVMLSTGPAPREVALANDIAARANAPIMNLAGTTSIQQLVALCGAVDIVLGPDSGTLHIANAQGAKVVGLYAHSNPARTGPYYHRDLVVDAYSRLLCQQKGSDVSKVAWGTRLKGSQLMAHISVTEVIDKLNDAISRVRDTEQRDLTAG